MSVKIYEDNFEKKITELQKELKQISFLFLFENFQDSF